MTVWHRPVDPLAARATTVPPRHVGGGSGLVDEDQPLRVQLVLPGPPIGALGGDIGPVLLLRPERLFFSVSPSRRSVRCIRPRLAAMAWVAKSHPRSSLSVTSGRRATIERRKRSIRLRSSGRQQTAEAAAMAS
jgi:hypothetical protein